MGGEAERPTEGRNEEIAKRRTAYRSDAGAGGNCILHEFDRPPFSGVSISRWKRDLGAVRKKGGERRREPCRTNTSKGSRIARYPFAGAKRRNMGKKK